MSNSVSQSKMNTEPKVVSTQTTITSSNIVTETKPQQAQSMVNELRKEPSASETSTLMSKWSPGDGMQIPVRVKFMTNYM
jgi:hypothetical protein